MGKSLTRPRCRTRAITHIQDQTPQSVERRGQTVFQKEAFHPQPYGHGLLRQPTNCAELTGNTPAILIIEEVVSTGALSECSLGFVGIYRSSSYPIHGRFHRTQEHSSVRQPIAGLRCTQPFWRDVLQNSPTPVTLIVLYWVLPSATASENV